MQQVRLVAGQLYVEPLLTLHLIRDNSISFSSSGEPLTGPLIQQPSRPETNRVYND